MNARELFDYLLALEPWASRRKRHERCQRLLAHPRIGEFPKARNRLQGNDPGAQPTPHLPSIIAAIESREITIGEDEFNHPTVEFTTDFITLSHGSKTVELGRFAVAYAIKSVSGYAEALEPNPAAGNEDVTHPHVDSEHICLGDAHEALKRCGLKGELLAVKDLITAVLTTYNPESPYVPIHSWDGEPCAMCGNDEEFYSSDQLCTCEYRGCGNRLCEDHIYYCEDVSQYRCGDHSTYCDSCDNSFANGVSCTCPDCETDHCPYCIEN